MANHQVSASSGNEIANWRNVMAHKTVAHLFIMHNPPSLDVAQLDRRLGSQTINIEMRGPAGADSEVDSGYSAQIVLVLLEGEGWANILLEKKKTNRCVSSGR